MKKPITYLLLILGIGIVYYLPRQSEVVRPGEKFNYKYQVSQLKKKLKTHPENSPEAEDILKVLGKVRRKHFDPIETKNPGAFISALSEIKTGINGETYRPDYKNLALGKVKAFKMERGMRTKALPWKSRGPGNVSGRSRSIAIDPSDVSGNTWFVATVGGGVWKTTDGGDSWELKTPNLTTLSTTTIAISQSNPNVIYVGTGMGYGRVVDLEGSGVWKSIDHGETWVQLTNTTSEFLPEAINRIIVDPEDPNILVLCGNNSFTSTGPNGGNHKSGIYRSTDGGQSWTKVFDPDIVFGTTTDNRVQQVISKPGNFDIMYASVNEVGVVKSIDGGVNWEVSADNFALSQDIGVGQGTYSGVSTRIELAISPSNTSKIYASVERPFGSAALFMSTDDGKLWEEMPVTGTVINWHTGLGGSGADGAYTSGWFNNTIVVHPFDENIVFVGGVNLFRIEINTGGYTIRPIAWWFSQNDFNVPGIHADNHLLSIIPDNTNNTFRIVCPNDGGLAYSMDGGNSWIEKNGMISTQFYGLDKFPGKNIYIAGAQDNGTWLSDVDPASDGVWGHVIGGDGFEAVWNGLDPSMLLGSSQNGFIFKSYDFGASWKSIGEARKGFGPFITKIANSRTDPDLVFTVTERGLNRSDDFGETWTETELAQWIGYRPFSNVKISDANPQVVWATSRIIPDVFGSTGGIYVSRDGGFSFENISDNLPGNITEASGISTDPLKPGTAYLLFSAPGVPKILKTLDYGQSWEDLSGFDVSARFSPTGFPDVAVFSMIAMPFNTDILWAGTEIGLFISNDGGSSWAIEDQGIPSVSVFDLKVRDNEVIAATYGRGIWTTTLDELANYTPPTVTLSPRLLNIAFLPSGNVELAVNFRSNYDSTHIFVDDQVFTRMYSNPEDTLIILPVTTDGQITSRIISFKDGVEYKSGQKSVDVFVTSPQISYVNLVRDEAAANDFLGSDFKAMMAENFSDFAFHSPHPYPQATELVYQLKIPIIIAAENSILEYSDIAILETGNVSDFNDPDFFDYVVVEGTKDGANWIPLEPGYDSRANEKWLQAYNGGGFAKESIFVKHKINLKETFSPGETIFIRFRLYSDSFVTAWGWAIDNIIIQSDIVTGIENSIVADVSVYPNPAYRELNIAFEKPISVYSIQVHDMSGRLLSDRHPNKIKNNYKVDVWGLNNGTYILTVILADGKEYTHRFVKK